MTTSKVSHVHSNPPPVLAYVQSACLPTHRGWIYGLTLFAFSNYLPNSCLRDLRTCQFHKVECALYARVPTRSVNGSNASSPIDAAHTGSMGSASFRSASSHRRGTLVSGSARFTWDLTSATSIVSLYSAANSWSVLSRCLINISDAAFVRTLAFPDRVSEIHRCTQAESVRR